MLFWGLFWRIPKVGDRNQFMCFRSLQSSFLDIFLGTINPNCKKKAETPAEFSFPFYRISLQNFLQAGPDPDMSPTACGNPLLGKTAGLPPPNPHRFFFENSQQWHCGVWNCPCHQWNCPLAFVSADVSSQGPISYPCTRCPVS